MGCMAMWILPHGRGQEVDTLFLICRTIYYKQVDLQINGVFVDPSANHILVRSVKCVWDRVDGGRVSGCDVNVATERMW